MNNLYKPTNVEYVDINFSMEPLLRYENMPKAAQFMPDAGSLKNDQGVDLEVCQCAGCGFVQLSNIPVPYYREVVLALPLCRRK